MFPEDMVAQRQKLLDELAAIVAAVSDLDALVARTAPLGARHVEYGVEPDHYELVGEALQAALADVLGDGWDARRPRRGPMPTTSSPRRCCGARPRRPPPAEPGYTRGQG